MFSHTATAGLPSLFALGGPVSGPKEMKKVQKIEKKEQKKEQKLMKKSSAEEVRQLPATHACIADSVALLGGGVAARPGPAAQRGGTVH